MIASLHNVSYEERLAQLNLFFLEKRLLRGKIIECFKILKVFTNEDTNKVLLLGDWVSSACHQSGATNMDLTTAAYWLSYFDFPSLDFENQCQSNSLYKGNNQLTSL